jgi:hypothetical protein
MRLPKKESKRLALREEGLHNVPSIGLRVDRKHKSFRINTTVIPVGNSRFRRSWFHRTKPGRRPQN